MSAPYPARAIAQYFVNKSIPGTANNLTNLKLQKILYYAQGYYYCLLGIKLFNEDVYAFRHGPGVVNIYNDYLDYNFRDIIPSKELDCDIDEEDRDFLDIIWEMYKDYNGKQLEYLTRQERPWKLAIKKTGFNREDNNVIDLDDIRRYFLDNYITIEKINNEQVI